MEVALTTDLPPVEPHEVCNLKCSILSTPFKLGLLTSNIRLETTLRHRSPRPAPGERPFPRCCKGISSADAVRHLRTCFRDNHLRCADSFLCVASASILPKGDEFDHRRQRFLGTLGWLIGVAMVLITFLGRAGAVVVAFLAVAWVGFWLATDRKTSGSPRTSLSPSQRTPIPGCTHPDMPVSVGITKHAASLLCDPHCSL
jgi:hypothetical protein